MQTNDRKFGSNRVIVIGSAIMIVLYLAFGRAMADAAPVPQTSLRMALPAADMGPTGAPQVLDAHYGVVEMR